MAACLEIATKQRDYGGWAKLAGTLEEGYAQSIIGMTESTWKRTAVRHALMKVLKLICVLVESFQTKKRVV